MGCAPQRWTNAADPQMDHAKAQWPPMHKNKNRETNDVFYFLENKNCNLSKTGMIKKNLS